MNDPLNFKRNVETIPLYFLGRKLEGKIRNYGI